jgi:hypothetical protein
MAKHGHNVVKLLCKIKKYTTDNDGHSPKRTCDITAQSNGCPHGYDKTRDKTTIAYSWVLNIWKSYIFYLKLYWNDNACDW